MNPENEILRKSESETGLPDPKIIEGEIKQSACIETENSRTQVESKDFKLGILLVHGIGNQPPGDTLIRWGDILFNTIKSATGNEIIIKRGSLGGKSGDNPAEIEVEILYDKTEEGTVEKWVVTEGWWADSFPPPTFYELVSWSFRAVPWVLATHIAQRFWQKKSSNSKWTTFNAFIKLLYMLAIAPIIISLLAGILLLGILPIPKLRTILLSLQSTLTATVGDSLVFVESPVRASFIKTRILENLEQLTKKCDKTIIIAHSQGAGVVMDALGGIRETEGKSKSKEEKGIKYTLLTFGSGINKLASLKQLARGRIKKIFNPASVALICIMGVALFITVVLNQAMSNSISFKSVIFSLVVIAAGYLSVFLYDKIIQFQQRESEIDIQQNSDRKTPPPKKLDGKQRSGKLLMLKIGSFASVLVFIGGLISGIILGLVTLAIFCLILGIILLFASLVFILQSYQKKSKSSKEEDPDQRIFETGKVQRPPTVDRWIDIYASNDPVPNGATLVVNEKDRNSIEIWNHGSPISDHTSYWDNLDGFVLRVAGECARTAGSDKLIKSLLPFGETCLTELNKRSYWRVKLLNFVSWSNYFVWLGMFIILCFHKEQHFWLHFDATPWLPEIGIAFFPFIQLMLVITIMALLTSGLIFKIWILWVRSEQRKILDRNTEKLNGAQAWFPIIILWMIVCFVLGIELFIIKEKEFNWNLLLDVPGYLVMFTLGPAGVLSLISSCIFPQPELKAPCMEPIPKPTT